VSSRFESHNFRCWDSSSLSLLNVQNTNCNWLRLSQSVARPFLDGYFRLFFSCFSWWRTGAAFTRFYTVPMQRRLFMWRMSDVYRLDHWTMLLVCYVCMWPLDHVISMLCMYVENVRRPEGYHHGGPVVYQMIDVEQATTRYLSHVNSRLFVNLSMLRIWVMGLNFRVIKSTKILWSKTTTGLSTIGTK